MNVSAKMWAKYIRTLQKINSTAAAKMLMAIEKYGLNNNKKLIEIAFALSNKYGEAAGALACMMYDSIADASGVHIPSAVPAETATYGEIAKAVNGTIKTWNPNIVTGAVCNMVKRVSADTMLKNALRDGAQFAWVPSGDSCGFCITLASRGWQYASDKAIKNGHAEHIHANCDCNYCVRFNDDTDVEGYDPEEYLEKYYAASPGNWRDKVNALQRENYMKNKDKINAQRRAAYAAKKERENATKPKEE